MKIHTETRSKNLITQLYNFGLSVSYYRVLQLENQLTNAVCKDYCSKGTVTFSKGTVYDKTSDLQHVNEARQEMFCQKEKSMERLPPTQDAAH